jgi:hypothetical protein
MCLGGGRLAFTPWQGLSCKHENFGSLLVACS